MIVQLSEKIKGLAEQKREMEKFRNELQNLSLTNSELQTVSSEVNKLKSNYNLIYSRLPETYIANIESRVKEFVKQVKNSRMDFSNERRQTVSLKNITGNIRELNTNLAASWKIAADILLKPYFELYDLVRQLPDFQSKSAELSLLKNRLDYFKNNMPVDIKEMRQFDQILESFKLTLASIQGLTQDIQSFLTKVVNHTATISDLNEEIVAWCNQADRGKVFQIQFRN